MFKGNTVLTSKQIQGHKMYKEQSKSYVNSYIQKDDNTLMETAQVWQKKSKATRRKVGACISRNGHPIMTGYNGLPRGADDSKIELPCPDCDGEIIDLGLPAIPTCTKCGGKGVITNPEVHHAERNALDRCLQEGISTKDAELHVTLSPCLECAKSILAAGIKRIVFKDSYRKTEGIDYLKKYSIEVVHLKEYQ